MTRSIRLVLIFVLWLVPASLRAEVPADLQQLVALEAQVRQTLERVRPAVVGVQVGRAQGSGVVISEDGLILTAGHVLGGAGRECTILFPDGRRVRGVTLGADAGVDSGMIRITDPGPFPFAPVGDSLSLKRGQWVITLGHPGGFRANRPPVLRVGRILSLSPTTIVTDTTLVGGDSGGALFDLEGHVIAIHSRIGQSTLMNMHVPVEQYTRHQDRLLAGEVWDSRGPVPGRPIIGVWIDDENGHCLVESVSPGLPAAEAGMRSGDIIRSVDGQPVRDIAELQMQLSRRAVGDSVKLAVDRDGVLKHFEVRLVAAR